MAHELNNPAAAVKRGAGQLEIAIAAFGGSTEALGRAGVCLQELRKPMPARDLDPVTRSDREEEIEELLDELGVEDPFELAPALVELGYNREAIQTLDDDTVADVETQTRALARGFGRHKGLEYAALHRLGDARPVIGDRHYHAAVLLRGDIEVFSEPGRTCFEVRLPIHGSTDQDEGSAMTAIHRPDDDELRRILPVNPNLNEVLGEPAHAELNAITEPIDSVVIFRRAEFVPDIVSAAIDQGVKVIWMQDGIRSPASRRARPARGPSGGYGRLYARQLEPPVGEE